MRIVYMGTPDFAAGVLEYLVNNSYTPVAVITAPDKPAGRGLQNQASAVKKTAQLHGITVLQPTNLKDPLFLEEVKKLNADLFIVVAFRMLPKLLWQLPPKGTFNLHASLLPQYRGAAPINYALINGEKESGVTTFFINEEIDTGNMLLQEKVLLNDEITAGELHDLLMKTGSQLVLKTVQAIEKGSIIPIPQNSIEFTELKSAPKIFKPQTYIHWDKPGTDIHNLIRGMSPYPGAISWLHTTNGQKKMIKILRSKFYPVNSNQNAGLVFTEEGKLFCACLNGKIEIIELQPEGKKPMKAADFLRGNKLEEGSFMQSPSF